VILTTKTKISLARLANRVIVAALGRSGGDQTVRVRRRGFNWVLDLSEGIDFAVYLTGAFEPSTAAALKRLLKPGQTALDIGANMGAHTLAMARAVSPGGKVFAIEPTQGAFARLSANIAANRETVEVISAHQVMLTRTIDAPLPDRVHASWPMTADPDEHPEHLGVAVSTAGAQARPLDDFLDDQGVDTVDLIKMDVDGFEMDVLVGGRRTIEARRPAILMEVAPSTWRAMGEATDGPTRFLEDLGYRFFDLKGRNGIDGADLLKGIPDGASRNVLALPG